MIERMLEGIEVRLGVEYSNLISEQPEIANHIIYCGPIDAFYGFELGALEYRSLRFESEVLDEEDHQGVTVVNYIEREVPHTRIIEHKHFQFGLDNTGNPIPELLSLESIPLTGCPGMNRTTP